MVEATSGKVCDDRPISHPCRVARARSKAHGRFVVRQVRGPVNAARDRCHPLAALPRPRDMGMIGSSRRWRISPSHERHHHLEGAIARTDGVWYSHRSILLGGRLMPRKLTAAVLWDPQNQWRREQPPLRNGHGCRSRRCCTDNILTIIMTLGRMFW